MKNQIENWLKKWRTQPDDYDPEEKFGNEQAGKEDNARQQIRESVFTDPFSDSTRRTRRTLLGLSVASLLVNAGHQFSLLRYIGNGLNEDELRAFAGVLAIGMVYFLVQFIVSAGYEYLRWRISGNVKVLSSSLDWTRGILETQGSLSQSLDKMDSAKLSADLASQKRAAIEKVMDKAVKSVPDMIKRIERTANYYASGSRIQMTRILFIDFALPLLIALLALSKVASLVLPMIARIASA